MVGIVPRIGTAAAVAFASGKYRGQHTPHHISTEAVFTPPSPAGAYRAREPVCHPRGRHLSDGRKHKLALDAETKTAAWGLRARRLESYFSVPFHLKVKLLILILYFHMSLLERQTLLR